jgi:hypothetical protein
MSTHEYTDNEDRPPPFNETIVTQTGVNDSSPVNLAIPADYTLRGYQSVAVRADGHGTAVTVEVGWRHSGDGASIITVETKTQSSTNPETLLFVNQGDILDHVTLTGGGNTDVSVVESNNLPLPRPAGVDLAQYYNLGGEPGLIDPVNFVGSDVYNAPNFQVCEMFSSHTTDANAMTLDAVNHCALIKKQGFYIAQLQVLQADRAMPALPIAGIAGIGVVDSLGGGQNPGDAGQVNFPWHQGYIDGETRDLTVSKVINAYNYPGFLPLRVRAYYAPAVNTSVDHGNWSMLLWRMRDGDITFFL